MQAEEGTTVDPEAHAKISQFVSTTLMMEEARALPLHCRVLVLPAASVYVLTPGEGRPSDAMA